MFSFSLDRSLLRTTGSVVKGRPRKLFSVCGEIAEILSELPLLLKYYLSTVFPLRVIHRSIFLKTIYYYHRIGVTSHFAHALGLTPFKDTFWTTPTQPGNPYGSKGTEERPNLQVAVATLRTGMFPVPPPPPPPPPPPSFAHTGLFLWSIIQSNIDLLNKAYRIKGQVAHFDVLFEGL